MLNIQRVRLGAYIPELLFVGLLCGFGSAGVLADSSSQSFQDLFTGEERAAPTFTQPEVTALLADLPPITVDEISPALAAIEPANPPPAWPVRGESKGPGAILKKLLASPAEAAASPPEAAVPPAEAAAAPSPPRQLEALLPLPEAAPPAFVPGDPRQPVATGSLNSGDAKGGSDASPREKKLAGRPVGGGKAVWYEHPGRTASGEKYNPDGFTAAHRKLPFGTQVRVVNRKNGRSVVVRINDRGPPQPKFVIDLSRGSARALGITGVGSVALYALD